VANFWNSLIGIHNFLHNIYHSVIVVKSARDSGANYLIFVRPKGSCFSSAWEENRYSEDVPFYDFDCTGKCCFIAADSL